MADESETHEENSDELTDENRDNQPVIGRWMRWRNFIAFWFLGLTNNFAYVVMLSAAHDILKEERGDDTHNTTINVTTVAPPPTTSIHEANTTTTSPDQYLSCNPISTGAILLADILPTFFIKLTAPFYIQRVSYRLKVSLVILFSLASFILVALAHQVSFSILGVVCASCGAGLGEITFLSLSAFYDKRVVSAWSSGTGAAGVAGSLGYAGLTLVLSARNTVLSLLVVPVMMGVSYFLVLTKPEIKEFLVPADGDNVDSSNDCVMLLRVEEHKKVELTLKDKLRLLPPLLKYMLPLSTVYFAEYFINQGLHELLYYNNFALDKAEQYRWYQVVYQVGVFISRSSVSCIPIKTSLLWILPLLQLGNMSLLLCQVFLRFIPHFGVMVAVILWEGLLGGSAYVNTFTNIRNEIKPEHCEFSLGVASLGDTVGVSIAGAAAIPSHNLICRQRIRM